MDETSAVFPDFPDHAALRVVPAHPPLAPAAAQELETGLAKLFAQFVRESSVERTATAVIADGALVLIAWECDEPLSGCRKDRLARLLAEHERRSGSELLAPPPVVIDRDGAPRCMRVGELRSQLKVGALTPASLAWHHLAEDLGTWRAGPRRALADLPYLARALA